MKDEKGKEDEWVQIERLKLESSCTKTALDIANRTIDRLIDLVVDLFDCEEQIEDFKCCGNCYNKYRRALCPQDYCFYSVGYKRCGNYYN
jgi:hypothetical protein